MYVVDTALGPMSITEQLPDGMQFYQIEGTWPPAATMVRSNQIFTSLDRLKEELPKFVKLLETQGFNFMDVQLRVVVLDYMR